MRMWWTILIVGCAGDGTTPDSDGPTGPTGDTGALTDTTDTATTATGELTVEGFRCHGGGCLLTELQVDEGDDGTVDRVEDLFVLRPERIELRFDGNGDGEPDTRYALLDHDVDCNLVEETVDEDRDGLDDRVSTWTWDAGLIVADAVELPGITSWSTTYTHDGSDLLVREERDDRQDGTVDVITTHTWAQGREIREEVDSDADGTADLVRFWAYDTAGQLLSQQTDYSADGVVDEVITWTWDADRPLRAETDYGADGTVEAVEAWVYDAAGLLIEYRLDTGNDGNPELRVAYTRDGDGQAVEDRTEEDFDSDGGVDAVEVISRTWLDGRVAEEAVDAGGDGSVEERLSYTWTCPTR